MAKKQKDDAGQKADPKAKGFQARRDDDTWEPIPIRMEAVDWETSEAEWFVPGHNEKGQSVRLTVRMSPEMNRAMDIHLSSKIFCYKTVGDLVRHAIYRHLFLLHRIAPTVDRHMLSALETMRTILYDDEKRAQTVENLTVLTERIVYFRDQGNLQECLRLGRICISCLSKLPDTHDKKQLDESIKRMMAPIARAWAEQRGKSGSKNKPDKLYPTDITALPAPVDDEGE